MARSPFTPEEIKVGGRYLIRKFKKEKEITVVSFNGIGWEAIHDDTGRRLWIGHVSAFKKRLDKPDNPDEITCVSCGQIRPNFCMGCIFMLTNLMIPVLKFAIQQSEGKQAVEFGEARERILEIRQHCLSSLETNNPENEDQTNERNERGEERK